MRLDEITAVVLTFNEAPNLRRCLDRLRWARRVVVVDSDSTDETGVIAAEFPNVDFLVRSFDNHTRQWNHGLDAVETEWVLALDADYVLGSGFEDELATLEATDGMDAFDACFRYVVFGRPLSASLYPARAVLFRKARCRYEQDGHTQTLRFKGSVVRLQTMINHDDRKSLSRWLVAQDKYATLEAEKLMAHVDVDLRIQDRLRRTGWAAVPASLVYTLLVKGTILDGWRGWHYALQRMLAELLLALRLIEKRFGVTTDDH